MSKCTEYRCCGHSPEKLARRVGNIRLKIELRSPCIFKIKSLKVPKREIFDRSDFPDFYTIKCLHVGDFGVKIKIFKNIFGGSFRGAKFLTSMLSLFLRRFFF
jgi:hypothetical protein